MMDAQGRQPAHVMSGSKRDGAYGTTTPAYSVPPYVTPSSPWCCPPGNAAPPCMDGAYPGDGMPDGGSQSLPPPWCGPASSFMMQPPSPGNPGAAAVPYGSFAGGPQAFRPPCYPVSPSHAPPVPPVRDVSAHMKRFEEKARRTNSIGDDLEKPYSLIKAVEASRKLGQPNPAPWVNSQGFPLRPGKPDCKHFISKGWCAYGTLCKFNHPEVSPATSPVAPHYHVPTPPGHAPQLVPAAWGSTPAPYYWTPWGPQMPPNYMMGPHYYPGMVYRTNSIDSKVSSLSNVNSGDSDKGSEGGSAREQNSFYGH